MRTYCNRRVCIDYGQTYVTRDVIERNGRYTIVILGQTYEVKPDMSQPVRTCDKWASMGQVPQEIIDRSAQVPQRQHYISQTSRDKYTIIRRNGIEYASSTLRTQPRLITTSGD